MRFWYTRLNFGRYWFKWIKKPTDSLPGVKKQGARMKCENCGTELLRGAIICRSCNYNNALHRKHMVRVHGAPEKPSAQTRPVIKPMAPPEHEDNLIHFPAAAQTHPTPTVHQAVREEESAYPAWRTQVKERVRESRERRGVSPPAPEPAVRDESVIDPNPIVQSALKRIRRSTTSAPGSPIANRPPVVRSGAVNVAVAQPLEILPEVEKPPVPVRTSPKPEQKAEPTVTRSPRLPFAERKTEPLSEPAPATARVATPAAKPVAKPATPLPVQSPAQSVEAKAKNPAVAKPESPMMPQAKTVPPPPKAPPVPRPPAQEAKPATDNQLKPPPIPMSAHAHLAFQTQIIEIPLVFQSPTEQGEKPASLWVRTLAGGCDFEIVAISFLPIFAAYATLNTILGFETFFVMLVLLASLTFVYQAVTLTMAGRTFGMALLTLRLIPLEGGAQATITRRQKLLRAWAATIAFLCPPLNLLVKMVNWRRLSLPDLVSQTVPVEQ